MAIKLDKDAVVKMGRLVPVINQNNKKRQEILVDTNDSVVSYDSLDDYILYAVWVEDVDGKQERCILLTPTMLAEAEQLAKDNPEDVTERSMLQDLID